MVEIKENAILKAPAIDGFQENVELTPSDEFTVEPGKGRLLLLESKP